MKRKLLLVIAVIIVTSNLFSNNDTKLLTYINKNPGFTFEYPKEFEKQPLQHQTEVIRISAKNIYKLPVMVAHVSKKKNDLKHDIIVQDFIKRIKLKTPDSTGFKTIRQKKVLLKDGNEGLLIEIKWIWINGAIKIPMDTVMITVQKDDEEITLSGVYSSDQNLLKELTYLCMTLNLEQN